MNIYLFVRRRIKSVDEEAADDIISIRIELKITKFSPPHPFFQSYET